MTKSKYYLITLLTAMVLSVVLASSSSFAQDISRSTELSREAGTRIDRSKEYNQQIGERIDASQTSINEARNYLERNVELFDRLERANRQRQEDNQTLTDATQLLSDGGSWSNNRSSDSSIER